MIRKGANQPPFYSSGGYQFCGGEVSFSVVTRMCMSSTVHESICRSFLSLQGRTRCSTWHLEASIERDQVTGAEHANIRLQRDIYGAAAQLPRPTTEERSWIWADWPTLLRSSIPLIRALSICITSRSSSQSVSQDPRAAHTVILKEGTASVTRLRLVPLIL